MMMRKRVGIDLIVLFKMVLIQHLYGITSLKRAVDEIWVRLKFDAMNLKKIAEYRRNELHSSIIAFLFL